MVAFLWWCGCVFCDGVVVFVFLLWRGCVFCGGVVAFFVVVFLCFCECVVVFLRWCL